MAGFPPRSPESGLELPAGEIHVWSVRLDPPAAEAERLGRSLSADEWERANRFRFEKHRRQYVVGRGALRTLLAAYLGIRPEAVRCLGHIRQSGHPLAEDEDARPASPRRGALARMEGEQNSYNAGADSNGPSIRCRP